MKAKTMPASPTVASSAPHKSSRPEAAELRLSGRRVHAMSRTAAASGTLSRKAQAQEARSTRAPPSTGPMAAAMPLKPDQVPIAPPRSACGKAALMSARLPGTSKAAPTPCTARARMSWCTVAASAQPIEAAPKSATPIAKMRRLPKRSPKAPPTSNSAASIRAYDSTTHCASKAVAWKSRWIAGSATLTTVPSTKAMPEPRIAATSTQRLAAAAQGVAAAP